MSANLSDAYNITVIDHINQRKSELTLDDAIHKFNCDLSKFDCVMLSLAAHDTLTGHKQYKPAKSMLVITNNVASTAKPINYSDFSTLNCKFATPQLCTTLFLDNLELTMELTKKEAKKLKNKLLRAANKHKRITFRERKDTSAKFNSLVNIKSGKESTLSVLLDPCFKNISQLKVSYNPQKANSRDLTILATVLKSVIGIDYRHRILDANITRFDIAFDSNGYTVDDMLFTLEKCTYFKQFQNLSNQKETTIVGASKALRLMAYNKTLESKLNNETFIRTRFEISVKPYNIKKVSGLKLKHINCLTGILSGLSVLDKSKVQFELGENSIYWDIINNYGISALRRTLSNTERVKLTKVLNDSRLKIDTAYFDKKIISLLKEQRDFLLFKHL
ncbi:hypothetical protein ACFSJY_02755 [Thalassotalea euphylliae]|uniref:hypothetical protein n=1 Tax=Thalassotalea euphylliae TaxID=1655234 RepID=UPI0036362E78